MNKDELFDGFEKQFESHPSNSTLHWGGNDLITPEEGSLIYAEEKGVCNRSTKSSAETIYKSEYVSNLIDFVFAINVDKDFPSNIFARKIKKICDELETNCCKKIDVIPSANVTNCYVTFCYLNGKIKSVQDFWHFMKFVLAQPKVENVQVALVNMQEEVSYQKTFTKDCLSLNAEEKDTVIRELNDSWEKQTGIPLLDLFK